MKVSDREVSNNDRVGFSTDDVVMSLRHRNAAKAAAVDVRGALAELATMLDRMSGYLGETTVAHEQDHLDEALPLALALSMVARKAETTAQRIVRGIEDEKAQRGGVAA